MADLDDDSEVNTFCDYLEDNYPDITVIRVRGNDDIKQATNQMVAVFSVLFVVTFLMVIFVTVSLSEKIVSERMAVIGTLRSLGISQKLTTFLLLIENVAYGLIGFVLGTFSMEVYVRGYLVVCLLLQKVVFLSRHFSLG